MSSGQSIQSIRIQYNIPADVTDSEVMKFAQDNNIVIDFSGKSQQLTLNTEKLQQPRLDSGSLFNLGENNSGASLLGGTSQSISIFGNTASQNTSIGDLTSFSHTPTSTQTQQVVNKNAFNIWKMNQDSKAKKEETTEIATDSAESTSTASTTSVSTTTSTTAFSRYSTSSTFGTFSATTSTNSNFNFDTELTLNPKTKTYAATMLGKDYAAEFKEQADQQIAEMQNKYGTSLSFQNKYKLDYSFDLDLFSKYKAKTKQTFNEIRQAQKEKMTQFEALESKVLKEEVINGKKVITYENGKQVTFPLLDDKKFDPSRHRSDVDHMVFGEGLVHVYTKDGKDFVRRAKRGEPGFKDDGKTIKQHLQDAMGKLAMEGVPEGQQRAMALEAFKEQIINITDPEERLSKFEELLIEAGNDAESRELVSGILNEVDADAFKRAYELTTQYAQNDVQRADASMVGSSRIGDVKSEHQVDFAGQVQRDAVTEEAAGAAGRMYIGAAEEHQATIRKQGYDNIDPRYAQDYNHGVAEVAHKAKDAADAYNDVITHDDEEHSASQILADHNHEADADIQKELAQILMDLNVDAVTGKIASHAYEYDITNQDDIVQMVKDHGNEGAQKILEEAKQKYEAQADTAKTLADAQQAKNEREQQAAAKQKQQQAKQEQIQVVGETRTQSVQKEVQTKQTVQQPRISVQSEAIRTAFVPSVSLSQVKEMMQSKTAAQIVKTDEFKQLKIKDSVELLKKMNDGDRKIAIENIVESSEGMALQGYMFSEMKNDIIRYLVSHPTGKNNDKLQYIERFLGGADKRYIKDLQAKQDVVTRRLSEQTQQKPFNNEV